MILGHTTLHETEKHEGSLDLLGVAMFFIAQSTLIFALNKGLDYGWTSAIILGSIICSVIFWVIFIFQESRTAEPLINLNFLKMREIALAYGANVFPTCHLQGHGSLPFYFEVVKYEVSHSGLMLTLCPCYFIVGPQRHHFYKSHLTESLKWEHRLESSMSVLSTFNPSSSPTIYPLASELGTSVGNFQSPKPNSFSQKVLPVQGNRIWPGNTSNMIVMVSELNSSTVGFMVYL
jgi:hypothetical protein